MADAWSVVDVYMKLPMLPCQGVIFGVFVCVFCFVWDWAYVMAIIVDRVKSIGYRLSSFANSYRARL